MIASPSIIKPDPNALLAAVVASSDDAIVSKMLNGIVTSWNPAAERMFGYSAEEMIGQSILRLIPPDQREEEDFILGQVRAGKRVEHYETVRMAKDGTRVHVSLTVSPIRDASGVIVGASKIARDIGQQREADRARAHLAAIVASSDDAIISKDLNGIITSWNPAAERLFGATAEQMVGQTIRTIIPPELQGEEDRIIARIRSGQRVEHFETVRLRRDGSRIELSITVSPVRDATGRIIGASKIARDITAQRRAQREKDQFLAILAHELRNPLAPISGSLEVLDKGIDDPARRARVLDIAKRQMRHMARLLDDLLDVARLSTGTVRLRRERFDVCASIEEAIAVVKPQVEKKRQKLDCDLAPGPIEIIGDRARIFQLVSNLLTNANKYTPEGGTVCLSSLVMDGWVQIDVEDSGIGMPPELIGRLFQLFVRGESAEAQSQGGLGIGLALVKDFAERHGGTLTGSSEGLGKGSRFTVRLPLADTVPA